MDWVAEWLTGWVEAWIVYTEQDWKPPTHITKIHLWADDPCLRFVAVCSTAQRICKLFEASQSGSVESKPSNSRRYLHSLSEQAEIYLIGAILENPCMYLDELCLLIENVFNISVSDSTICRIIHKYGEM